jgi:hypothetical protein
LLAQALWGLDRIEKRPQKGATDGEFVITPALMMGMDDTIIDWIAFGGVKELEELYLCDR